MHKNLKKSFVTEREQERKTAKKLSACGAQNFLLSAERERKQIFWAHWSFEWETPMFV